MAKTPEELAAAQAERDKIKTNAIITKEEKKEEVKEEKEEVKEEEREEEKTEEIEETKEEVIEETKEEIKESEKTEEELEAEKAAAKTQREKDKIQKKIDKEIAKRKILEDENAELKRQLAAKNGEGKFTEEDVKAEAKKIANQDIAERDFANACARLEKGATKLDKNFPDKIEQIGKDIGPIPSIMIGVLDDLDNGAQVLHHFTVDEDEYERIRELTPTKMAVELTKLSEKLAKPKPKPISKVPPPIEGLGGTVRNDIPLNDKMPMDEWVRRRNQQVAKRREERLKGMH